MTKTIYAKLITQQLSRFTEYVFKDLETGEYIMCTRLPNWHFAEIDNGEEGYLTYEEAVAGQKYTTPDGDVDTYRYNNIYFKKFVKNNKELEITI